MPKQYYKFKETNWYTNESAEYFIPLTEKLWRSLSNRIKDNAGYLLAPLGEWKSEREVDEIIRTHRNSTSAIKNVFKCEMPKSIPKVDSWEDYDPFYNGECWRVVRPNEEDLT